MFVYPDPKGLYYQHASMPMSGARRKLTCKHLGESSGTIRTDASLIKDDLCCLRVGSGNAGCIQCLGETSNIGRDLYLPRRGGLTSSIAAYYETLGLDGLLTGRLTSLQHSAIIKGR